jgi:hypothetical protein
MKIYLAANYSRHPEMREYRKILESRGFKVTSRWINGEHEVLEGQSHEMNVRFAQDDWDDLEASNLVIWFSSEGKENRGRGGRHVEFGLALAWGIQIFVVGRKENVFHWLSKVKHFENLEDAIKDLKPFWSKHQPFEYDPK